ncbi:MAG: hypothetical protein ACJASR_000579 [Psychroserpens sp.]|jgi:hypothetical protein
MSRINTKEIALVSALIAESGKMKGTVLHTFDEIFILAQSFIKKYPHDFEWGSSPLDMDEAVELFIDDSLALRLVKDSSTVLTLTLHSEPFNVMITGEKSIEYRDDCLWARSRLLIKGSSEYRNYDLVLFINGYGAHRPFFYAEFKGIERVERLEEEITYSNGLKVGPTLNPIYKIFLGEVRRSGHLIL